MLLIRFHLLLIALFAFITAGFPLDDPYLVPCTSDIRISPAILQTCIDKCLAKGHSCSNRLLLNGGECDYNTSSAMRLSCAHGCEIAYYTSTVDKCKAYCDHGNSQQTCAYKHPTIDTPFSMCGRECGDDQRNQQSSPKINACSDGCEFAAATSEFYRFVEIPRFLFAGQSNMVRKRKR
jgi:hypothetical protein